MERWNYDQQGYEYTGGAAHLNSLAEITRKHLKPDEMLRLQTRIIKGDLILSIYFEDQKPIREFARRTEAAEDTTLAQTIYNEDWDSGENYFRNKIVLYLKGNGYDIESVATKSEKGRDIIINTFPRRIIEVKGYPSKKVSQGKSKGKIKNQSQRDGQALGWIWEGIRQLIEHKCKNLEDEIALGLPAKEFYRNYLDEIKWLRKKLSIFVYFVYGADVKVFEPSDNME